VPSLWKGRALRAGAALALGATLWLASGPRAEAAPEWIFRRLTLPRGDVAVDLGLGLGHAPIGNDRSTTGFGMNLEIAVGVTHDVELGFRTGTRIGTDGEVTQADRYGRTFDTETYGTRNDGVADPELRMTWSVAQGSMVQLGLEGRVYLPIEQGSRVGLMFAVPLRLRLGAVRVDTGIYVPLLFYDPTYDTISFPVHIWLQASRTLWLGPLLGVQFVDGPGTRHTAYPLGFGLGSAVANAIDLRGWILFPDIGVNEGARTFGAGLALQIRFE
jgi:hypothetical protein